MLLVGDLVYNDDFDCNCNYRIYDCTAKDTCWHDEDAVVLWDTVKDGWRKPLDTILDMRIKYITTDIDAVIIIEAMEGEIYV